MGPGTFAYESLIGTGFLIGKNGFAVTAAHVVDQMLEAPNGYAAGFKNPQGQWVPVKILAHECHSSEDVAVLQLDEVPVPSWLSIISDSENQSCTYDAWGYPISVAEIDKKYEAHGMENPELVYTHGYIRRRVSRSFPFGIYRGSAFYELSEVAGAGCSGGPMVLRKSVGQPKWKVIGIYVGEVTAGFFAGYATRADAFFNWSPKLIGKSIKGESA